MASSNPFLAGIFASRSFYCLAGDSLRRILRFLCSRNGRAALCRFLKQDKNEHILDPILVRTSYARYLRAKTAAVLLSGAAAVLLPAVMLLGFCYLIFPAEPNHVLSIYFNFSEIYTRYLIQPGLNFNPSLGSYAALSLLFLGLFGGSLCPAGYGNLIPDPRSSVIALGIRLYVLQLWLLRHPDLAPPELDEIYRSGADSGREPALSNPAVNPDRPFLSAQFPLVREKRTTGIAIRKTNENTSLS